MKHWKDKTERGSAAMIWLIGWLARTVGRRFCRALFYPIVLYFMLSDAPARAASREFLAAATGRRVGWHDTFAHFLAFGATLLDRVYMAAQQFWRFDLSVHGDALVERALTSGKGCVLLGSHLGSFDLLSLANQSLRQRPVSMLMHVSERAHVRRFAGIDDTKLQVIALGRPDSLLRAYEVLQRGGIVAALADRTDGGAQLASPFLGRAAAFPLAPHVLAARAGATVLVCFGLYEGGARYRIEFIEFGPPAPPQARGGALQPVVDRYAALLEQYARKYPLNWFNFYPYWSVR